METVSVSEAEAQIQESVAALLEASSQTHQFQTIDAHDLDIAGLYTTIPGEENGILFPVQQETMVKEDNDEERTKTGRVKKPKTMACNICGKTFSQKNYLNSHLQKHYKKPIQCPVCDKIFPTTSKLNDHRNTHTGDRPHPCTQCDKRFFQLYHLKVHMDSVHKKIKNFTCEECNTAFARKSALNKHMLIHTREIHICGVCSKKFNSKANVDQHQLTHSTDATFSCDFCQKTFPDSKKLKDHVRIHTREKPFNCDQCPAKFEKERALLFHKGTHDQSLLLPVKRAGKIVTILPHNCSQCSKKFASACQLKRHIRTHTGERPYECGECHRLFTQRSHLKDHIRTQHSKDSKVTCPKCNKKLSSANTLRKHMITHTWEKEFGIADSSPENSPPASPAPSDNAAEDSPPASPSQSENGSETSPRPCSSDDEVDNLPPASKNASNTLPQASATGLENSPEANSTYTKEITSKNTTLISGKSDEGTSQNGDKEGEEIPPDTRVDNPFPIGPPPQKKSKVTSNSSAIILP